MGLTEVQSMQATLLDVLLTGKFPAKPTVALYHPLCQSSIPKVLIVLKNPADIKEWFERSEWLNS